MTNEDRRVLRTKKAIKETLAEMLLSDNLESIKVSKITEAAGISRMAFYYHYEDLYDLYDKFEFDFFSEFTTLFCESPTHDYRETMSAMLDFLQDNANTVKYFSLISENRLFRSKLASAIEDKFTEIVMYEMGITELTDYLRYIISYHSGGMYSLFMSWIESDFACPKDDILNLVKNIDECCDPLYTLDIPAI